MKKLYYTETYEYLAKKIKIPKGKIERKKFSDGEKYIRLLDDLKNVDVYILGGTVSDEDTLDIYDIACASSMYGANSVNLIVPYFGYSTMERAVLSGEVVKAKTRARIFSSIPRAVKINTIYLFDLHVSGLVHYFENEIHPIHMYGKNLVKEAINTIGKKNLVLGSPDEGRVKWVSSLAKDNDLPFAIVLKNRVGEEIEHLAINADVKGKNVLIYDDMIRSGNTIISAANAYKKSGASKIYVFSSHAVFTNDNLIKSELIDGIFITDSHPNAYKYKSKKINVLSINKIILEYL